MDSVSSEEVNKELPDSMIDSEKESINSREEAGRESNTIDIVPTVVCSNVFGCFFVEIFLIIFINLNVVNK